MQQSNTLSVGMEVQHESMAVASVAHESGAEVVSLGRSAPARVTSTGSCGSCPRRASPSSWSTTLAPAATGALAI
jgi:hypothetical protein